MLPTRVLIKSSSNAKTRHHCMQYNTDAKNMLCPIFSIFPQQRKVTNLKQKRLFLFLLFSPIHLSLNAEYWQVLIMESTRFLVYAFECSCIRFEMYFFNFREIYVLRKQTYWTFFFIIIERFLVLMVKSCSLFASIDHGNVVWCNAYNAWMFDKDVFAYIHV